MPEDKVTNCQLAISAEEYEQIQKAEAVCLCEYEQDGRRTAELISWGAWEDMLAESKSPTLRVVWNHDTREILGKRAVLVRELIPPEGGSDA